MQLITAWEIIVTDYPRDNTLESVEEAMAAEDYEEQDSAGKIYKHIACMHACISACIYSNFYFSFVLIIDYQSDDILETVENVMAEEDNDLQNDLKGIIIL